MSKLKEFIFDEINAQMKKLDKAHKEIQKKKDDKDFINTLQETYDLLMDYLEFPNLLRLEIVDKAFGFFISNTDKLIQEGLVVDEIIKELEKLKFIYSKAKESNDNLECTCEHAEG